MPRRLRAHIRAALGLAKLRRGGQPGNRNRLRHGLYSGTVRAGREKTRGLLRQTRELVALMKGFVRETRTNSEYRRRTWRIFCETPPASRTNLSWLRVGQI